jgi:hypothetical protein
MHKYLKSCLATAVLGAALCAPAAHAVDFLLVDTDNSDSESVLLAANAFFGSNDFSFQLDLNGAAAAISTIDLSAITVALGGSVQLFNATPAGAATTAIGLPVNLPLIGIGTYATFTGISDGFYVLRVQSGLAAVGLLSTITATAAPVPEAETYAMMLAGLGLVGTMVARRRHA